MSRPPPDANPYEYFKVRHEGEARPRKRKVDPEDAVRRRRIEIIEEKRRLNKELREEW